MIYRTNKIILKNPKKVTDEMALDFYTKSDIPEVAYYKSLAAVSLMGYKKTALAILKEKINNNNIELVLDEWNDFINSKEKRIAANETVIVIQQLLLDIKNNR